MTAQIKQHDCKSELRSVALKATPARLAALSILEATDNPLDAATIIAELQKSGIDADPATIFRMMNSFANKGLVKPIQFNEGKLRYEHSEKADHHHFICENCGAIEDISDCNIDILEKDIKEKKGLLVKHHSLEFFGLCQNCQN